MLVATFRLLTSGRILPFAPRHHGTTECDAEITDRRLANIKRQPPQLCAWRWYVAGDHRTVIGLVSPLRFSRFYSAKYIYHFYPPPE